MNNKANVTSFKPGHRQSEASREKIRQAHLGSVPWNKGRQLSAEHIAKLREAHKGQKPTCGFRKGHIPWHKGRGTKTPELQKLRTGLAYKAWRTQVFERDKYTCQECGTVGGRLNADHILKFAKHPEKRFDVANGRTLCVSCHRKTPTFGNRKG